MITWLVRIFNLYLEIVRMPEKWASACIKPLYKENGDIYECTNSKDISVFSVF